jgi:hypothetical protein
LWSGKSTGAETRYFRSDTATVNGLLAYKLLTAQSSSHTNIYATDESYWGIRVYKRTSNGTETEVTSGVSAVVHYSTPGDGYYSATVAIPETALASTDSIVVKLYSGLTSAPANLRRTFSTEQLGAGKLDAATWTVYYYLICTLTDVDWVVTTYYFYHGSNTRNSRITNFTWSSGGTAHFLTVTEIFGALDSRTRAKTTHRTLTEKLGALDSRARAKTAHRALTELFGSVDVKTRVKTVHRALTEKLGALDAKTRSKSINRAFTELLGGLDVKTRLKSIYRTFTESLGELDTRTRAKSIYREITEKLGLSDSKSRAKSIFRTFTEKFGLSDTFSKTKGVSVPARQWGYSVPFSIFRRIGLSGVVIRPQQENVKLKAGLLDRKVLSSRVHGKAVASVSQPIKINISSLLRRKSVGVHGISVVHVGKRSSAYGRLLHHTESSAKVVGKAGFGLLAEALGLLEATYSYMFVAVTDDKTCDVCMKFDKMIIDGAEIERMFPYATQIDYSLWMVNLHPSCRCMLVLLEIGS